MGGCRGEDYVVRKVGVMGEIVAWGRTFTWPKLSTIKLVSHISTKCRYKTYEGIPRSSAQAHAIIADTQTTDAVVMANQRTNLLAAGNIPDLEIC